MSSKSTKKIKRVLVLSGGGGRGAFQAGVCRYLWDEYKHKGKKGSWRPDMILGNSIGATNGAILCAPKGKDDKQSNAACLERLWLEHIPKTKDFQKVAKNFLLCPAGAVAVATSLIIRLVSADDCRPSHDALLQRIDSRAAQPGLALAQLGPQQLKGLRSSKCFVDRPGWKRLLEENVNFGQLNSKENANDKKKEEVPYFGIAATRAANGEPLMFWNREPPGNMPCDEVGIKVKHLMASSSIPAFYEPTEVNGHYCFDGALAANTPIRPAIEAGATDIIVVLMTPWSEKAGAAGNAKKPNVWEALDCFVEWMMLGPFRTEWSHLSDEEKNKIRIIAPEKRLGVVSILDYDKADIKKLYNCGKLRAAKKLEAE